VRQAGGLIGCIVLLWALSAGSALGAGITNSGNDLRDGWYGNQPGLAPDLVGGSTFGKLWSTAVDGQVYAQPLVHAGHVIVATERNQVLSLDSETGAKTGSGSWGRTLPHGTPWNPSDVGCNDLRPDIGVTATPVIDDATKTIYLTHKTYASGTSGPAVWWMDALDAATGDEKPGFPVKIEGAADNAPGVTFDPTVELQRPGLLLMDGVVYAAFGGHCDYGNYQGWVFGVSTAGAIKARWAASDWGAGIWQSGSGLMSDGRRRRRDPGPSPGARSASRWCGWRCSRTDRCLPRTSSRRTTRPISTTGTPTSPRAASPRCATTCSAPPPIRTSRWPSARAATSTCSIATIWAGSGWAPTAPTT
jgi:hypothetical protein